METQHQTLPWPPILGLWNSVVVASTYMRRNRVQAEIAETYSVSQPTIGRAVTTVTPIIKQVLKKCVPTTDELDDRRQYVVDGMNVQIGHRAGTAQGWCGGRGRPTATAAARQQVVRLL